MMTNNECLTLRDVMALTKRGKTAIWDSVAKGRFPKPVKIGGSTRWVRSEVEAWLAGLMAKRDAAGPKMPVQK